MMGRVADAARQVSPSGWLVGLAYAIGVAVIAAVGFAGDSTSAILVAAFLSLPASVIAIPGFYLAYGVLALVPGANPNESSGSGSCTKDGACSVSTTGDLAPWFQVTTDVLGVLALTCAALLNLLALRMLITRRRRTRRVYN
jgi:hypothetical protein